MMEKIVDLSFPQEHYKAKFLFVGCFDWRFVKTRAVLAKKFGFDPDSDPQDTMLIPGGIRSLASPEKEGDRDFTLRSIGKSVALHAAATLFACAHQACGDYGGKVGKDFYEEELTKAGAVLKSSFPGLKVNLIFADFDGIWIPV